VAAHTETRADPRQHATEDNQHAAWPRRYGAGNAAEGAPTVEESGRIVIEIDPDLKQRLHALLALQGTTLKDWFVEKAAAYVGDFGLDEETARKRLSNIN